MTPVTKISSFVPVPDSAAVLCAADGCDHQNCHGGSFRVVYVGTSEDDRIARACVYSSDTRAWSPVTSCQHDELSLEVIGTMPKTLVGNALYFPCITSTIILRLQKSRVDLWSMEAGQDGSFRWALSRVVELENMLPHYSTALINSADALGVLFARTHSGVFTFDLKSGRVKKISTSSDYVMPYMSFYTPDKDGGITPPSTMASLEETVEVARDGQYDLLLLHSSDEESEEEDWGWKQEKAAEELFNKGSIAIEKGQFVDAKDSFHEALQTRVLLYGRLSPKCLSTYFKYGCALLYARLMSAPNQDLLNDIINKHDTTKDLDLAWKMFRIAKAILENTPSCPLEKAEILSALAEVSTEREDIDYSLSAWFKALAILERLVQPDDLQIILLNLRIFWAFESASKIKDAIPYREKATILCKSRVQKLEKAKEVLLADEGGNASATEVGLVKSCLDKQRKYLTPSLTILGNQLERLEQALSIRI